MIKHLDIFTGYNDLFLYKYVLQITYNTTPLRDLILCLIKIFIVIYFVYNTNTDLLITLHM